MNCSARALARGIGPRLTGRRALATTPQLARKPVKGPNRFSPKRPRNFGGPSAWELEQGQPGDGGAAGDVANASRDVPIGAGFLAARKSLLAKQHRQSHDTFQTAVRHRFRSIVRHLKSQQAEEEACGIADLEAHAKAFHEELLKSFALAEDGFTSFDLNPLYSRLRDAFTDADPTSLKKRIDDAFMTHIATARFTPEIEEALKRLVDMRFPHEWFPATRALQRTVHVHVGPTNSGKTYNALQALENAKSGVYAGPLRLLATEVYQRLQAKGRACSLVTGEELRIPEDTDTYFSSCTVEMTPLNRRFDVAVIDEIQMITDEERGNAWSTAFLGVQAKEVHLCGEERTVHLLKSLCAVIGDKCIVHRYQRLSPLETMAAPLNHDYSKLEKGDAVVAFSRLAIHKLKKDIEESTGRRCAIIYGSLPPEVRVQQAALFNDPNNDYDYVVASDAIGMGLNLEIRRVIFENVRKFDGRQRRLLRYPEIKQIGGRAGRYRTAASDTAAAEGSDAKEPEKLGLVTTMQRDDLRVVHDAFSTHVGKIMHASLYPAAGIIERFASFYPPGTPLSFILMRIKAMAKVGPLYKLDISESMLDIADTLHPLPLTIYDRLTFCFLPVSLRNPVSVRCLLALAQVVADNKTGDLLDIEEIPLEYLDLKLEDFQGYDDESPMEYLARLEGLHVTINQYLWLSFRYAGVFRSQAMGLHVRALVEKRLVDALESLNFAKSTFEENRRRNARIAASSFDAKLLAEDAAQPPESQLWQGADGERLRPRIVG